VYDVALVKGVQRWKGEVSRSSTDIDAAGNVASTAGGMAGHVGMSSSAQ